MKDKGVKEINVLFSKLGNENEGEEGEAEIAGRGEA